MKYLLCAVTFLVTSVSFSSDQNTPVHFAKLALLAKLKADSGFIGDHFKKLPHDKDTEDYIDLSIDAIVGLPINLFTEKIKKTSDTTLKKVREDLDRLYHMAGLFNYGAYEAPSLCGAVYLNSCCCNLLECNDYSCLTRSTQIIASTPGEGCANAIGDPVRCFGSIDIGLISLLTNYVFYQGMKKLGNDLHPKKEYIDEINKLLISKNGPETFTLESLC